VPWTVLGYITSRAVSLLGTLAIARLLMPEDLGVVYTGMIVVSFVNLLTDSGLGLTMVTRERLDDRMAGTILTCMTAGGVILSAAVALGAVATAWIAEPSRLTTIMPALSTVAIFTAVGYFHTSLLHRAMEYSRRFAGQFALSVGYVAVALPLVALGAGVWGLVAGQILAAALSAAVLVAVAATRWPPTARLGRSSRRRSRGSSASTPTTRRSPASSGPARWVSTPPPTGSPTCPRKAS
jgi:PST family polysaccharide transporter